MMKAIENEVIRREQSYWRYERVSAISTRFERNKYVWHLLFHVGIFNPGFPYIYTHTCILCFIVVGLFLYRMFAGFIICFVYFPITKRDKRSRVNIYASKIFFIQKKVILKDPPPLHF